MSYKARYDFQPRDNDELALKKGEVYDLIEKEDNSWYRVRDQRGNSGSVPKDFLEEIQGSRPPVLTTPNKMSFQSPNATGRTLAVVKYAYQGTRDDELSLEKDELVEVLEKEGDGWWRGRVRGKDGWFPANYVDEKGANASVLGQESGNFGQERNVICRVVAMYTFTTGNSEELQFRKGDILEVTEQPEDDPDWWEARNGEGISGLIPRNYVEVIVDDEPKSNGSDAQPFCKEVWYHGKMSRTKAEDVLKSRANDGQFLVRESETKKGDYSISVKAPDIVKHFRVQILKDGKHEIGMKKFDSMDHLIEHYRKSPIYTPTGHLQNLKVYLTEGLPR